MFRDKEMLDILISDLENLRMPKIYKNIISYMYDILSMDGSAFNYRLTKFRVHPVGKHIEIMIILQVNNENRLFYVTVKPKDLKIYDISIINAKTKTRWKLDNIETSNYINSVGLLLHPDRLVSSMNVQYT